jgi:hypothetical protein
MVIYIVLVAVVALFYLYRQANIKRRMFSKKARQLYDEIAVTINYWAESKNDYVRFQLARDALASYDDWYERSTVLPIIMRNTTARDFAVLSEWRNLIQDSEWKAKNAWSGQPSDLFELEYAINRAALREHCNLIAESKSPFG